MKLADWLRETGSTQTEFARRIGVTQGYVTQLCSGMAWPGRAVAEAIQRETGGKVTANDFLLNGAAA
jgi:transcriptional regulator with XRE-family HTH domain